MKTENPTLHLYKLSSGETVLAEFLSLDTIDERTNRRAYITRNPVIVEDGEWWKGEFEPMVAGLSGIVETVPIPYEAVWMMAEGEAIDPILVEIYAQEFDLDIEEASEEAS